MDYKSTIYKECLELAEELIWEDILKSDFPHWKRDRFDTSELDEIKSERLSEYSDLEKIDLGQKYLQEAIQKNKYKNENSRQIDLEWLESFMEWRDIYNEKLLAKSRVL